MAPAWLASRANPLQSDLSPRQHGLWVQHKLRLPPAARDPLSHPDSENPSTPSCCPSPAASSPFSASRSTGLGSSHLEKPAGREGWRELLLFDKARKQLQLVSFPSPSAEKGMVPWVQQAGSERMHQLICTNGPRKAGSALQRRIHWSNNLNTYAFPSKKSFRREEKPNRGISHPHLHQHLAGAIGKELSGQGKASDLQSGEQLLEEATPRLDVQPCFWSVFGQTDGSLGQSPAQSVLGSIVSPK